MHEFQSMHIEHILLLLSISSSRAPTTRCEFTYHIFIGLHWDALKTGKMPADAFFQAIWPCVWSLQDKFSRFRVRRLTSWRQLEFVPIWDRDEQDGSTLLLRKRFHSNVQMAASRTTVNAAVTRSLFGFIPCSVVTQPINSLRIAKAGWGKLWVRVFRQRYADTDTYLTGSYLSTNGSDGNCQWTNCHCSGNGTHF